MRPHNIQHDRNSARIVLPDWAIYLLFLAFILLTVGLAYFTFNTVKKLVAGAPIGNEIDVAGIDSPGSIGISQEGAQIEEEFGWSEGRVSILLLGIDERGSESGPWRTDTMMLLTLDPGSGKAGMMSFPRDLWVEIPDYGGLYDKLNNAHFLGDADHYPGGGGPALTIKTIQSNFGVPIDYYATVNFRAFVTIIDYLGCIPVDVTEPINDPAYPAPSGSGYDPFILEAGEHCLGGETLLKYARTRATFGGDFDRAKRQQQVLYAIRRHVLSTNQLPNLITQMPDIYATLQGNVNTNLNEGEIISLIRAGAEINDESICSAVIQGEYIDRLETLPDGSQVVIPNRSAVRQLIRDIFNGTGTCQN